MIRMLNSGLGEGTNVTDHNLQPPCRKRQQARLSMLCRIHDNLCYTAGLQFNFIKIIGLMEGRHAA